MPRPSPPNAADAEQEGHDRLLNGIRDLLLASDRARHHMASTFGLSANELAALSHLGSRDNLGQRHVARRLGLSLGATTALIDRLEKLDLARRSPHPSDRRQILINLTPAGRERVNGVRTLFGAALTALPAADLATATHFLEQLSTELAHLVEAKPPVD